MSIDTTTRSTTRNTSSPARRRVMAMSAAELRLLLRNKTALFMVLAMPLLLVGALSVVAEDVGINLGVYLAGTLIGFVLLFVVYYNLVTTYVARREELVLKRLRTSEARDREVMLAGAVPSLAIAAAQIVLGVLGAVLLLDMGAPVNPLLVIVAVIAGSAVFVLLALVSTVFTRTTELAQVTTMPLMIVCLLLSGLTFPLDFLPDVAAGAARLLPLTPIVELTQLGLAGAVGEADPVGFPATFSEAVIPFVVLVLWLYLGVYGVRRWFRWDPRA
ncbi:MAG TPA: ABC transporter permease [Jiangellaceae bacterium]